LIDIRDLEHPHIIQWLATFTRGSGFYLMFPWADGGSLRDFWKEQDPPAMDLEGMRSLVLEALHQFRGLADAFVKLHMERIYRHGDVKPENILRFRDGKTTTGVLQIADFGLAKQHHGPTHHRTSTTTRHTTLQYESPEAEEAMKGKAPLSRLSDIWSLGCVMFEYLVWLLYGCEEAERFGKDLGGKNLDLGTAPFYYRRAGGQAALNPTVERWLSHMKEDAEGSPGTAIGALLMLIQNHMLTLGPLSEMANWLARDRSHTGKVRLNPGTRASAGETMHLIDDMIAEAEREGGEYLFKGAAMTDGEPGRTSRGPPSIISSPLPVRTSTPSHKDFLSPNAALLRHPWSTNGKNAPPPRLVRGVTTEVCSQKEENLLMNSLADCPQGPHGVSKKVSRNVTRCPERSAWRKNEDTDDGTLGATIRM
jgi:serine/threonine protein kinase